MSWEVAPGFEWCGRSDLAVLPFLAYSKVKAFAYLALVLGPIFVVATMRFVAHAAPDHLGA